MSELAGQVSMYDLDSWCGKMSPEPLAATRARISAPCLKKSRGSATKEPIYLDLRKGNGETAGASWETGGALLGAYTMRSFGECPSADVESHLWQILEEAPHPKYCLSVKACEGIVRRAEERGKELPPLLKDALAFQIVNFHIVYAAMEAAWNA